MIKMKLKILKTVKELKEYCKKHGIKGYSSLKKRELIELITKYIEFIRANRKKFERKFKKNTICRNCKIAKSTCLNILKQLNTEVKEICPIYRYKIKEVKK